MVAPLFIKEISALDGIHMQQVKFYFDDDSKSEYINEALWRSKAMITCRNITFPCEYKPGLYPNGKKSKGSEDNTMPWVHSKGLIR